MKEKIHPEWYPEATVFCACGNTWKTGATVPEIHTDICSACHPFYTGEQRIVDTEGQVDRFLKRLQVRDALRAEVEEREAARTPTTLPLAELGVEKRYVNVMTENSINTAGDFIKISGRSRRRRAAGDQRRWSQAGRRREEGAAQSRLRRAQSQQRVIHSRKL